MPIKRILYRALCLEGTVLKSARREGGAIVLTVSPRRGQERRRPFCARRSPAYDRSRRSRRWRAPDLGSSATYLEYIELEGPEAAPTLIAEELVLQVPEETLDLFSECSENPSYTPHDFTRTFWPSHRPRARARPQHADNHMPMVRTCA